MNAYKAYENWLTHSRIDENTRQELETIRDQPLEIEDRFYRCLSFGTGGIRGILGAGTNRMNRYTVRKATEGLAQYIQSHGPTAVTKGVVIAYDSRHYSKEFAIESALTLLKSGIKAYVFCKPSPTPLLSYSVKKLGAISGIVITASHNPPEYNGYKVYWEDGGQIVTKHANQIAKEMDTVDDIPALDGVNKEIITWLDNTLQQQYIEQLQILLEDFENININDELQPTIVYTPLHGTGGNIVRKLFDACEFRNALLVKEQEDPDPDFSTVSLPNPEDRSAFNRALDLANKHGADIVLATDPDCDRLGVMVKHKGQYIHLNGNQVGAILLDEILSRRQIKGQLPDNSVLIKTIVTSDLGKAIAEKYGVETINTLTGFKYIGEKIHEFELTNEKEFVFGYEESCGYLTDTFVRDKDGIMSLLLISAIATYYRKQKKTLFDALENIYTEHGYYLESLQTLTLTGKDGIQKMRHILEAYRGDPPTIIGPFTVTHMSDYLDGTCTHLSSRNQEALNLPKENALKFSCLDKAWFCIRPSGTEPKLKIYFAVKDSSKQIAQEKLDTLIQQVMRAIQSVYK